MNAPLGHQTLSRSSRWASVSTSTGTRSSAPPRSASRAVQRHPNGSQFDLVWLAARTPHGGACQWGVRVVSLTKSRKILTLKMLPLLPGRQVFDPGADGEQRGDPAPLPGHPRRDDPVRVTCRSTSPRWGPNRFRLALRTYAPWGIRVVSVTKSRNIPPGTDYHPSMALLLVQGCVPGAGAGRGAAELWCRQLPRARVRAIRGKQSRGIMCPSVCLCVCVYVCLGAGGGSNWMPSACNRTVPCYTGTHSVFLLVSQAG